MQSREPRSHVRLDGPESALWVAREVLFAEPTTTAAALLESPDGDHGTALPFVDPGDDREIVEWFARVLFGGDLGGRLVLVSYRDGEQPEPCEADLDLWRRLVALGADSTLDLLDWLVLYGRSTARSMAELAGPPPRWWRPSAA
jgi:hypothetical protein